MQSVSEGGLEAAAARRWDVIVVGTGVGGATLGHALARAGWRVLFCERGHQRHKPGSDIGHYPEEEEGGSGVSAQALLKAGRYERPIVDVGSKRDRTFVPFIGAGAGGSSTVFGMAMERFMPSDFEPGAHHANAADTSLPTAWPLSHEALLPFYAEAEALYRVRGGADPLNPRPSSSPSGLPPPPGLSPEADQLATLLSTKGLHPYRLPMACEYLPGCQCCQGFVCPRACKNDSERICLVPAVDLHGAELIDECEVVEVLADASRVTGLRCRRRGQELLLHADTVVLAAGALHTPHLLLRSRSAGWPDGVANRSGQVGRNLMRHLIDLYLISPLPGWSAAPIDNRFKEIAFNDFYLRDGAKLGSVQSFGRLPTAGMLYQSLRDDLRGGTAPWLDHLIPLAAPVLRHVLGSLVDDSLALATTLEDLPYADNRVLPATDGAVDAPIRFAYTLRPYEQQRVAQMRQLMKEALSPLKWRIVKQADNNQRIAHVCGTCRFGDDPTSSVLDADNRAHDLRNLYVVDSSFFPSSGGTNPSLTIAANALRVARRMTASTA